MDANKIWLKIKLDSNGEPLEVLTNYPILKKDTGNAFYVQSPVFRTVGYSLKSIEDAILSLQEDNRIFFKVHLHRSTLKSALLALGWRKEGEVFFNDVPEFQLEQAEFKEQLLQCA